jgi:hypothetical protein
VAAAVGVLVPASVVAATLALASSTATAGRPERDAAVCEPPRVAPVQSTIARDAAVDPRTESLRQRRRKSVPGVRACAPLPGAPPPGAGATTVAISKSCGAPVTGSFAFSIGGVQVSVACGAQSSPVLVQPGTVRVEELSIDPAQIFASVVCQGPRSGESSGPVIGTTIFVPVRAGEAWTCTWINLPARTPPSQAR